MQTGSHVTHTLCSSAVAAVLGSLSIPIWSAELEEVTVTAQRRTENLQEVNLPISAFTQSDLDRMGANNIERLSLLTPGLEYGQFGVGNAITIRGSGRAQFEASQDGSVGFFVDGIYRGRGQQEWVSMLDVERVEITRGPQGTLYGRNTTGGNISIITNKPDEEFEGWGDLHYGNFDHVMARGMVNIPVNDVMQARFSAMYQEHDGFIESRTPSGDDLLDEDQVYFQGALRFTPTEDVELVVRGHYWEQGGDGYQFAAHKLRDLPGSPNSVIEFVDGLCTGVFLLPQGACVPGRPSGGLPTNDDDPYAHDEEFPATRDVDEWGVSAHLAWDFDSFRFTSITGYTDYFQFSEGGIDFSPIPAWAALLNTEAQTFSQEIHLSSTGGGPLEWLVGFHYLDDEIDEVYSSTLLSFPAPLIDPRLPGLGSKVGPTGLTLNYRDGTATTESWAVFGQASYYLTEELRITGGVRYTEDDKFYGQTDIDPGQRSQPGISDTFEKETWLAGIDYSLTDENRVYFTFSTGFRSGFFNRYTTILPGQNPSVGPETVDNYEFGSKNRFFDNRLQANVAIFWNDISNAHTFTFDTSVPTSVGTGAGKASTFGVEFELQAVPVDQLQVTATMAYLDAEYDVYKNFTDGTPGNVVDASGHKRERSPEWTASLTAAYDINMGAYGTLTPYLQWAYKDEYFVNALNDPRLDLQDSFSQTDVRVLWESAGGDWNAEAYVQNIEDNGPLNGGFYVFQGMWTSSGPEPRTAGVRVGYRF